MNIEKERWDATASILPATRLDALAVYHTRVHSFSALLDAPCFYFHPSPHPDLRRELTELADAYDRAQAARDDPRRARRS